MTFPLMPAPRPARFLKGALTHTVDSMLAAPSNLTIPIGMPSEDRWVVFCAIGSSGGAIGTWSAPTINGVAMTQIVQDGASGGSDGQRGAIWIAKVSQGDTAVLNGALGNFVFGNVFTLTGVANPVTNFVTRVGSGSLVTPVPSCAIFYTVDNFGAFTSITNMTLYKAGNRGFGVDYITDANPMTYTITGTSLYLNRFVTWPFDY